MCYDEIGNRGLEQTKGLTIQGWRISAPETQIQQQSYNKEITNAGNPITKDWYQAWGRILQVLLSLRR